MMRFAATIRERFDISPQVIIPGGGFGVADDASGNDVSIARWAEVAANALVQWCADYKFEPPTLVVEPGRSIVGPAGVALYEVGAQKTIAGVRTYVSVDGGMADNVRPALYGARYTAQIASRDAHGEPVEAVTIAGKYCESGDVLIHSVKLPALAAGDLLAVPMAGAYCIAMASNYNLAPRPAVVLVNAGRVRLIRRRESYEDVMRCEVTDEAALPRARGIDGGRLSAGKGSL
jgi:diaminopimelate decarboxylase